MLKARLLLTALVLSLISSIEAQTKSSKPNILFILADDQSFNTIHALGHPVIQTPHLDQLVERGVTFTHAYNMGAWHGAVCVASRTMFNTGRTVWRARTIESRLQKQDTTAIEEMWGNLMNRAGYDTYMAGKWHVKAKVESCFKYVATERPGMPNQTAEGYNRPLNEKDTTWLPWHQQYGGYWKGGKHWSEVLGDETVDFINDATKRQHPFFMYIAFNAPHDPRQSPKAFVERYPLDSIRIPDNFLSEYPDKDVMGCSEQLRDERLAPFPRTEYAVKVNRQEYYAIITHMDQQIGRILDALEASGLKENTYIFYTADHGLACGQHGLMGKQNMYDHSMRAPLIIIGPDLPANKCIDADVYIQDIMPSALEIAGVDKPTYVEFSSLLPLIKSHQMKSHYKAIYGAYMNKQRMIRSGGFKLIIYPGNNTMKLFNLENDPHEMNNLADDPQYRGKMNALLKQLINQQQQLDDPLQLDEALFQ